MKIELVKQLMIEFEKSQVHKMKVEIEGIKLEMEKPTMHVASTVEPASTPVLPTQITEPIITPDETTGITVKAPLVGVFYRSSSPTTKPYIEVGDTVKKGQVLCIVEAMKVMNEIKAPVDGVVRSIAVDNDALVEFDQILMVIEG